MATMSSIEEIERLCGEYSAALRLEQHKRVSELCLAICDHLVQLFDEELLQNDIEEADQGGQEEPDTRPADIIDSDEWQLVESICDRLRKQSILAQANAHVSEFVRQQDRACLDELLERLPRKGSDVELGYDSCATVLRQSILLLKELQLRSSPERLPAADWLPGSRITRLNNVSFSRHFIDLNRQTEPTLNEEASHSISDLLEKCNAQGLGPRSADEPIASEHESGSDFYKLISSSCFRAFIDQSDSSRFYGFDKFAILVAIWIVASQCEHTEAERLLSELVGQMFHQETNSGNLDEFLLLTQTGSVWLSYKKQISVSLQHLPAKHLPSACDRQLAEGSQESLSNNMSSLDSSSSEYSDGNTDKEGESTSRDSSSAGTDGRAAAEAERAQLRAIIDDELLVGKQCGLCDSKPSGQPMEPLQLFECPGCSLELKPARLHLNYCHHSFQPLDWLLPLDCLKLNLKLANLKQLLVLTPNEWVQRALEVCSQLLGRRFTLLATSGSARARAKSALNDDGRPDISERVQISDKFERLTVVRRAPSDQTAESSEDDDDDHDDLNSNHQKGPARDQLGFKDDEFADFSDGDESSERAQSDVQLASVSARTKSEAVCLANLEAFFRWRYGQVARLPKLRPLPAAFELASESLQAAKRAAGEVVALNSADLLALDSLGDCISLFMVTRSRWAPRTSALQHARDRARAPQVGELIFGCLARSQTSQLRRGCARLFLGSALAARSSRAKAAAFAGSPEGANGCDMALNERPNELKANISVECPACGQELVELRPGNLALAADSL